MAWLLNVHCEEVASSNTSPPSPVSHAPVLRGPSHPMTVVDDVIYHGWRRHMSVAPLEVLEIATGGTSGSAKEGSRSMEVSRS